MVKAKSKKTKKTKQQDAVEDKSSSVSENQPQPALLSPQPRRSMLPHNMTHEINLLKDRVASLESLVKSLLNAAPKSAE